MDATALAGELLDALPANRTLGLTVVSAADGVGVVRLPVERPVTNVIGSLHASGIAAIADAAALAAMLSALPDEATGRRLQPLGTAAHLAFHRPVRGVAIGTCRLDDDVRDRLGSLTDRTELMTRTVVAGEAEDEAATGDLSWTVRLRA